MTPIRDLVAAHEASQNELARRAGMDPKSFSEIARGLRDPRISTAQRMAKALGCTLNDLFPLDEAA